MTNSRETKDSTETKAESIDVMLLYNSVDRDEVEKVYWELKRRGMNPWMDKRNLRAGRKYQREFARAVRLATSAAVFYGKSGLGKWECEEIPAVIQEFIHSDRTIIPVFLPGVKYPEGAWDGDDPSMKDDLETVVFLRDRIHVVFEWGIGDPEAYDVLQLGITGKEPRERRSLYQIQVEVPNAERSCFIAFPAHGPEPLYDTISQAVEQLGIECSQFGAPSQMATPCQLAEAILSSELVIGVCAPDAVSEQPSPHTMFLLGQAMALGKPVLCITPDATSVPPLVAGTAIVEYTETDLKDDESLRLLLVDRIQNLIATLRHPFLTDPQRREISVAYADMLRIPICAWDRFEAILSFGLEVDRRFREVAKHVHKLQRDIAECFESATGIANAAVSERNWRVFRKAYRDWMSTDLPVRQHFVAEDGSAENARVPDAFNFLENHTHGPLRATAEAARAYFDLVLKTICVYLVHFAQFCELAERAHPSSQQDVADLSMVINQLVCDAQTVHSQAHAMMANLLGFLGK